jgi:hypothetical protein
MNGRLHLVLGAALCALCAGTVLAQEQKQEQEQEQEPKPELLFIVKEVVKPSMAKEYEDAVKQIVKEFEAYGVDPEQVSYRTVSGPEIGYIYVMPMEDFGSMETIRAAWMDAIEKIGQEKFMQISRRADSAVDHGERFHVARRPNLSYMPEKPSLTPEDVKFVGYSFLYVLPGHEQEFEELAEKYAALYKRHGIDIGWAVYQSITGADLPLYVVARGATSRASFHATSETVEQMLGEEGEKLGEEARKHLLRVELKEGWLRPDLSYPPMEQE